MFAEKAYEILRSNVRPSNQKSLQINLSAKFVFFDLNKNIYIYLFLLYKIEMLMQYERYSKKANLLDFDVSYTVFEFGFLWFNFR